MRVAIVQEYVDIRRGGAETSTLEMAGRLGELGLEVTVICAGSSGTEGDPAPKSFAVREIRPRGGTKTARTRDFVTGAAEFCDGGGFDIVQAITPCPAANVYQPRGGTYAETIARTLAVTRSAPVRALKSLGRRMNLRQQYLLRVERSLLNQPSPPFVAAVSELVRGQIRKDYPGAAGRARVVFNGVDFKPLSQAEAARARQHLRQETGLGESSVVLFAAHNFRLKGLRELIEAFGRPELREWRLIVAGRDGAGPYQRLAVKRGVAGRVTFLGAEYAMPNLYATADVLAHPTWYDPCSRVVLEALIAGLPVVTTRLNGAAEAVGADTGAVIDAPSDIADLAQAIRSCDARERAREPRAEIQERLSMARHARELRGLYEEVLNAGLRTNQAAK